MVIGRRGGQPGWVRLVERRVFHWGWVRYGWKEIETHILRQVSNVEFLVPLSWFVATRTLQHLQQIGNNNRQHLTLENLAVRSSHSPSFHLPKRHQRKGPDHECLCLWRRVGGTISNKPQVDPISSKVDPIPSYEARKTSKCPHKKNAME